MASHDPLQRAIRLSIAAAILTMLLKSLAYFFTGSVGFLSDALESGVNLVAAVTAFLTLAYAARPVDSTHTYGHEKIAYFSSGLEGVLIILAGLGIGGYAVQRLITPQPLQTLGLGTLLAGLASLINWWVGRHLMRVGREQHSIVLEADGEHLLTDVRSSIAVVLGVGLVWLTGWVVFDSLLALGVAGLIIQTGIQLIRRSFDGLMDHALPPADVATIRQVIEATLSPGTTFHALRTRQAGRDRFCDFHLLVPGALSVDSAHDLSEKIEAALQTALPRLQITIHIEPIEAPQSWTDHRLDGIEPPPTLELIRNDTPPSPPK
ncbi:cation diffusion facilitator family transporter [Tuwongella immobilis]|uniref:Uncharacterized protein n=1 Tax=Tuwongella immobilis TaxID=692036 RepID=A0A6C2YJM3_9BACT|nr:cation diffusion facilitator family transporter [Tuwongella immobilis]VIP01616.1 cation efflux protein : Cation diffusion facilitator family transporter OS=Roseiflexus sp. (strain RS-1) GN=RoseRS_1483 PE=4 SV=1: Cation_efflux [Tuwongella immobilis]VTR98937.1 cation efflux protein : Cation diffusion facilitator family transporter OS=Roseiflexus sp. (strain RS-1) GN=RoseRS_1483 PE=4 SV=1: Cation_efflux [Tuwongella immobilis]